MPVTKIIALLIVSAAPALAAAQPPTDARTAVARAEQDRLDAIRRGGDVRASYASSYRGITALGQYETRDQIPAAADPDYARVRDVSIDVHDDTAIVTGVEGSSDARRERVLRVWTRTLGVWTIAAAQTTWIGDRPGAPPPSGPLPATTGAPFVPQTRAEESLWLSQDALMHAFADANPDAYSVFSTDDSLRMQTNGDAIARDRWLETIGRRQKGPLAVVDEVRLSFFGDVALVTLRGHEMNPTRQSWLYLRSRGLWRLALRFTTIIRP